VNSHRRSESVNPTITKYACSGWNKNIILKPKRRQKAKLWVSGGINKLWRMWKELLKETATQVGWFV
jgi:hypothetical protein